MKKLLLLPILLLALTACSGNLSFNEEEIQEIAQNQPEGSFDVMFQKLDNAADAGMRDPVQVMRYKSSELPDEARQMLIERGWKLIQTGEYEEYKWPHDKHIMMSLNPKAISAIEVLNEITPEISERYGNGSENGVVIITMKDESTRNMGPEKK